MELGGAKSTVIFQMKDLNDQQSLTWIVTK